MVMEWAWAGLPIEVQYRHEQLRNAGRGGVLRRARRLHRRYGTPVELPRQRTAEPDVPSLHRAA